MITNRESLKAKLRNLSDKTNIASNYLLQSFMFEGLLKRISISKYREKFIIKGGMLLTSIFGVNLRSTMDLDATLKGLPLNIETITSIFNELINMNIDDNMTFEIIDIREIREEDLYGGYCINLKATFDKLWTHLMIDITTGDIITYKEIEFKYRTLFDDEIINILSYNYETIIAEKFESIISRNINNSRMKDYYDLYMFTSLKWNRINKSILLQAIVNTCKNRRTIDFINNSNSYIEMITNDDKLKKLWKSYQEKYEYAKEITFEDCINAIKIINEVMIPIAV
ncbi:nucleotidyl transferase AbiEii/AbiGii toxin family protein [Thomasclavelia cocleata]|uniref:nucleotidyl transferase AbiEii/AbiGii toxin family protein n=1 Tax=Thomasclavelia cocleata TaxID=69824 RepID=UPI0026144173|nr:nucleotidyl transferase AbiEii/AbiGii toxin family protein [Thomasclavelia cocleata]